MNTPSFPELARRPLHLLAFGLGSGLFPAAPGTAGTLAAVPLYLLLQGRPTVVYIAIVSGMFLAGIGICQRTARDLQTPDHPGIVWDEWVGYLTTMTVAPSGWAWIVAGFIAFRFFDVVKPWPIGWLDRKVSGGLGIMLDDLVAGLMASAVLVAGRGLLDV